MASAPTIISRSSGSALPRAVSATSCQYAGGRLAMVTPAARTRAGHSSAGHISAPRSTTVAPASRGIHSCSTATSKPNDAKCSARSPAPIPSSRPNASRCASAVPCSTATPLGRPVEPEV